MKKRKYNRKHVDHDRTIHLIIDGKIEKTYTGREDVVEELETTSAFIGSLLRDGKYTSRKKYHNRSYALMYGDKMERKELTSAEVKEKINNLKSQWVRSSQPVRVECTILNEVFFLLSAKDAAKKAECSQFSIMERLNGRRNALIWKRWKVGVVSGDELRMLQEGKYQWTTYAKDEKTE